MAEPPTSQPQRGLTCDLTTVDVPATAVSAVERKPPTQIFSTEMRLVGASAPRPP